MAQEDQVFSVLILFVFYLNLYLGGTLGNPAVWLVLTMVTVTLARCVCVEKVYHKKKIFWERGEYRYI